MKYLVWLNGVIVIALSVAFLVHFGIVKYFGEILIQEPHAAILTGEIVVIILCLISGMILLIKYEE